MRRRVARSFLFVANVSSVLIKKEASNETISLVKVLTRALDPFADDSLLFFRSVAAVYISQHELWLCASVVRE